jgi:Kdo2-lipid IVA lauroyltransferase/acyltransferase
VTKTSVKNHTGSANALARWAVQSMLFVLRSIPAKSLSNFAKVLAWCVFQLGIRRKVTLDNLRQAFPEKSESEVRRIAKASYSFMAQAALEAVTSDALSDAQISQKVLPTTEWKGLDVLLAAHKPCLIASAHFGSWELFAEVMSRKGHLMSAVVRPLTGAFNEAIVQNRMKAGIELILQRGALANMLSALKRNRVVIQLIDQSLHSRSALFPQFFGRAASTTGAVSIAAIKTGIPVFVVLARREGDCLQLIVEGPVAIPPHQNTRERVRLHTQELTSLLEKHIRQTPEQWLWLHRRWKIKQKQIEGTTKDY